MEISSQRPMTAQARWRLFASAFDGADLTYEVACAPELPCLTGESRFESERVRVLQRGGQSLRTYFDTITGKATVAVEEAPDRSCRITVREALLPWGTDVSDLFVAYGLPHFLPMLGKLLLHCAYILHEGRAILFTAPSGTGKSTQAALWQRYRGSEIINGDRAALGLEDGIVTAYGLPVSGSSDDCRNVTAPVAAIVGLSQARENRAAPLPLPRAVKCLLSGTYLPPEFSQDLPMLFDLASDLAQRVPVFHLDCLPDEGAVTALEAAFRTDQSGGEERPCMGASP